MASDSERRKFFRGPLGGPKFLQILYNDGFS